MLYTGSCLKDGELSTNTMSFSEDELGNKIESIEHMGSVCYSDTWLVMSHGKDFHIIADNGYIKDFEKSNASSPITTKEIKKEKFFIPINPQLWVDKFDDKYSKYLLNNIPESIMNEFKAQVKKIKQTHQDLLIGNLPNDPNQDWKFNKIEMYNSNLTKEMISKVDITNFSKIISYLNGLPLTSLKNKKIVDDILNLWAISKSHIYQALGNNLKVKSSTTVIKDDDLINAQLLEIANKFPQYSHYLKSDGNHMGITTEAIRENKITKDCDGLMTVGMKVSKQFKKWYNDPALDLELSKLIDNKTVDRYIWASIDPIDILFMAYTKSGWRSCHSVKDGEYRTGSFVALYDNSSIITFATSEESPIEIKLGTYNIKALNKCWRQVVYFNNDTGSLLFARQYPTKKKSTNQHKEVYVASRNNLETAIADYYGHTNTWKTSSDKFSGSINQSKSSLNSYFYCDIGSGDSEDKLVRFKETNPSSDRVFLAGNTYNDNFICPICGSDSKPRDSGKHGCRNCN